MLDGVDRSQRGEGIGGGGHRQRVHGEGEWRRPPPTVRRRAGKPIVCSSVTGLSETRGPRTRRGPRHLPSEACTACTICTSGPSSPSSSSRVRPQERQLSSRMQRSQCMVIGRPASRAVRHSVRYTSGRRAIRPAQGDTEVERPSSRSGVQRFSIVCTPARSMASSGALESLGPWENRPRNPESTWARDIGVDVVGGPHVVVPVVNCGVAGVHRLREAESCRPVEVVDLVVGCQGALDGEVVVTGR